MDRFLIAFPTGERLDFYVSKQQHALYRGEPFPLYDSVRSYIERWHMPTEGAKLFAVVEGKYLSDEEGEAEDEYVHIYTFDE